MPKPLGSKKTGGRAKGTPNKRTLTFMEVFESRGINLPDMILDSLSGLKKREKINILIQLLPYVYPKRKPTEEAPFSMNTYLDGLTFKQLGELSYSITQRMGMDKPVEELSMEQLLEHRRTIEEYIRLKSSLELLKDDEYSKDC